MLLTSARSDVTPTKVLRGRSPPLKMKTRGMLVTPYLVATSGASSTFSLPTFTLPTNCSASLSMVGPSWRHGPHQGAQKSTTTGTLLFSTSLAQLALVNSTTFLPAMFVILSDCGHWKVRAILAGNYLHYKSATPPRQVRGPGS